MDHRPPICKHRHANAQARRRATQEGDPPMPEPGPRGTLTLQTIAMPAQTNANGDIFGGWIMAQMDIGASVLARTRACGRVATVAVEAMAFHRPVHVGDVVSIHTEMLREGTTSMTIDVEVWVTRLPSGRRLKVTEAKFVFVAVDEQGRKRPLPAVSP
jgi:acyl-CoA thioesterase YciA